MAGLNATEKGKAVMARLNATEKGRAVIAEGRPLWVDPGAGRHGHMPPSQAMLAGVTWGWVHMECVQRVWVVQRPVRRGMVWRHER